MMERPEKSFSVRATGGQSVAAFFQSLLSARPPGAPDSTPEASSQTATPISGEPAPDFAGTAAGGASSGLQEAGVSFDDFFSSPGSGSASATKKDADPGKDDLDQFQSWLQNLKR
jgi:hypothetical protein